MLRATPACQRQLDARLRHRSEGRQIASVECPSAIGRHHQVGSESPWKSDALSTRVRGIWPRRPSSPASGAIWRVLKNGCRIARNLVAPISSPGALTRSRGKEAPPERACRDWAVAESSHAPRGVQTMNWHLRQPEPRDQASTSSDGVVADGDVSSYSRNALSNADCKSPLARGQMKNGPDQNPGCPGTRHSPTIPRSRAWPVYSTQC